MSVEITDWARDILTRSATAATRYSPNVRVRIARTDAGPVEAELTDEAEPGDTELEVAPGVSVLVEDGLDGLIDVVEPHDRIVLRPAGSTPNPREH